MSQRSSNPPAPSDRDWSTTRTKHQDTSAAKSSVPYRARRRCKELYIGATKQPIHKHMAPRRRATSLGQGSAGHLHLKERGRSFEDRQVRVLETDDRWFERGVKEAIQAMLKNPSLKRAAGLRHFLSVTGNAVPHSLGQNSKHSPCLTSPDHSPSCEPTGEGEGSPQRLVTRPSKPLSGDHPGH